ncbi:MAG: TadE family protein [Bdellovibrionota bacterium]
MSLFNSERCFGEESRGAIIVELVIAAPLLVVLFLMSSEYVRALQVQQAMAVISKEAANGTFRDCIELDNLDECIQYEFSQVSTAAQAAVPGIELLLSVYTYEDDPVKGPTVSQALYPPTGITASGKASRYSLATFSTTQLAFMQRQGKIAIAEVYYTFSPILEQTPIVTDFYDAAIY